jgi:hypothetical protein
LACTAKPVTVGVIGTWFILGAVLSALGDSLIGYLVGFGNKSRLHKALALGTGQRNLATHAFDADTFVSTLVACLVLTITMHVIAAEWGRREPEVAA